MRWKHSLIVAALSAALTCGLVLAQAAKPAAEGSASVSLVTELTDSKSPSARQFQVTLSSTAGYPSMTGRVSVTGAIGTATGPVGDVRWKVDGASISGSVLDAGGKEIATFDGTMEGGGGNGSFASPAGEHGTWVWEFQPGAGLPDMKTDQATSPPLESPPSTEESPTISETVARQQLAGRLERMADRYDEYIRRAAAAPVVAPVETFEGPALPSGPDGGPSNLIPLPPDAPGGEIDLERAEASDD